MLAGGSLDPENLTLVFGSFGNLQCIKSHPGFHPEDKSPSSLEAVKNMNGTTGARWEEKAKLFVCDPFAKRTREGFIWQYEP